MALNAATPALIAQGPTPGCVLPAIRADSRYVTPSLRFLVTCIRTCVSVGWRVSHCGIFTGEYGGVTYYLLDNEQYFKTLRHLRRI
jgi:starch synthase